MLTPATVNSKKQIFGDNFPTKRFVSILCVKNSKRPVDVEQFDDLNQCNEYITLVNETYKDHDIDKSFINAWGYVVLDMLNETVLELGHDGFIVPGAICGRKDKRYIKDFFFRKDTEIPEDYKWDDGEYEGWLEYRWGSGKNSIKPKHSNESKPVCDNSYKPTELDMIEEKYDKLYDKERLELKAERW